MGWTFLLDQDAPMNYAAKIVHHNQLLEDLQERLGRPESTEDPTLDTYNEESRKLGFNLADYYLLSKKNYQLTLVWRIFFWELYAIVSGIVCCIIPVYIYGLGVAHSSGKTDGLFAAAFAVYQANVLTHHMQMFVTIRNYTWFFGLTCTISLLIFWPTMILQSNYGFYESEYLDHQFGHLFFDQWFLQLSAVLLTTFVIVMPIYVFKFFKMRLLYPEFYPLDQSTWSKKEP